MSNQEYKIGIRLKNSFSKETTDDGKVIKFQLARKAPSKEAESLEGQPVEEGLEATGIMGGIRGKLNGVSTAYRQWQQYRQDLYIFPAKVEEGLARIEEALSDYRLTIAGLTYKAEHIDVEIWELYHGILEQIPVLKEETFRRPLTLRTRGWLYVKWQAWKELISQQDHLRDLLAKAPEALEFYDKMRLIREHQKIERIKRAEQEREIAAAHQKLEAAVSQIEELERVREGVTFGSSILQLESAKEFWYAKLSELSHIEKSGAQNVEEVLSSMYWLGEVIRDAPVMAKGVRSLEEKYSDLIASHDMLVSYGRSVIPQAEIARTSVMIQDEISKLWTRGDFDELDRILQNLENFITYYDTKVETELAIAERRRPGLTRALAMDVVGEKDSSVDQLIAMARTLVSAIDARDRYMRGHSEKVTQVAMRVARMMSWSESDLKQLEIAALLHDVGKLSIPENILTKTAPLTPHEWTIIQMHPYYSAQIIKPVKALSGVIPWVYHHQERWDGSGYPDHLAKKDIPLGSSIISLAEAYTAMTTGMPNKEAMPKEKAIDKVKMEDGKFFNPEVVEAFLDSEGA